MSRESALNEEDSTIVYVMNEDEDPFDPDALNEERVIKTGETGPPPVNSETTEREPYDGYLIWQGAIPEIKEFLKKIRR